MSEEIEKQIRQHMQEQDTDTLVEIWNKQDRSEWSEKALDVVRELLLERLGQLPIQTEISDMPQESTATESEEEGQYHDPDRLIRIAGWAIMLSRIFLVLAGLIIDINGSAFVGLLFQYSTYYWTRWTVLLPAVSSMLLLFLISLFLFVLCQAISEVIYLFLDIEGNTRSIRTRAEKETVKETFQ